MIDLTAQQRAELLNGDLTARDPQTNDVYVLIPESVYRKWKSLLSLDDYAADEGAAYVNEVMADDDAGDPLLDGYQRYGNKS